MLTSTTCVIALIGTKPSLVLEYQYNVNTPKKMTDEMTQWLKGLTIQA